MIYGEVNNEGAIVRDVRVCAWTGEVIDGGQVMVQIANTPYFVRLTAAAAREITPDELDEVKARVLAEAEWVSQKADNGVRKSSPTAE